MFDTDAPRGQCFIVLFLLGRKRMVFAFLVRGLAVGVPFVHALIAGIAQQFHVRRQSQTAVLEEGEVVRFARTHSHAENLLERIFWQV